MLPGRLTFKLRLRCLGLDAEGCMLGMGTLNIGCLLVFVSLSLSRVRDHTGSWEGAEDGAAMMDPPCLE